MHPRKDVEMDSLTAIATAVAEGKTDAQFAIPDGKYLNDLFFVTDAKHKILIAFAWSGERWIHEHEILSVEIAERKTETQPPADLKPVSVTMRIHTTND